MSAPGDRRRRRSALLAVGGLALAGLLAWLAALALVVPGECRRADALVMLAGGSAYRERADWTATLVRRGISNRVLLTRDTLPTGWYAREQRNPRAYERAAWALIDGGVPAERIRVLAPVVEDTRDEARVVRHFVDATGLASIAVVTSWYHVRRARWIFRAALEGSPVEVEVCGVPNAPSPAALAAWWARPARAREIGLELLKIVRYAVVFAGRD